MMKRGKSPTEVRSVGSVENVNGQSCTENGKNQFNKVIERKGYNQNHIFNIF